METNANIRFRDGIDEFDDCTSLFPLFHASETERKRHSTACASSADGMSEPIVVSSEDDQSEDVLATGKMAIRENSDGRCLVAIDPDTRGAVAIHQDDTWCVVDCPSFLVEGRRSYDVPGMARILREHNLTDATVYIEKQIAIPASTAWSIHSTAYGMGLWHGACVAAGCRVVLLPHSQWQKARDDKLREWIDAGTWDGDLQVLKRKRRGAEKQRKDKHHYNKKRSFEAARMLFPELATHLVHVSHHHGRAEALLMGWFALNHPSTKVPSAPANLS